MLMLVLTLVLFGCVSCSRVAIMERASAVFAAIS